MFEHKQLCHKKMYPKIFVIVIPKEGLVGQEENIISEGSRVKFIVAVIPKEGLAGPWPPVLICGYDDNDIRGHFLVTQLKQTQIYMNRSI